MYWKLFWNYLEASEGLLRFSAPAAADGSLPDIDKACDKIDYSES